LIKILSDIFCYILSWVALSSDSVARSELGKVKY